MITNERLLLISKNALSEERRQMAEELLSYRLAEPVAWRYRTTDINGVPKPSWSYSEEDSLLGLYQPLYER